MANKQYERVNWAAFPSKTTPMSSNNLNRMDKGIDDVDTKTTNLETRQDNYEAEMTNVKSNILKLNDSLNGIDLRVNPETHQPEWKERGASTEYRPFSSCNGIIFQCNFSSDGVGYFIGGNCFANDKNIGRPIFRSAGQSLVMDVSETGLPINNFKVECTSFSSDSAGRFSRLIIYYDSTLVHTLDFRLSSQFIIFDIKNRTYTIL